MKALKTRLDRMVKWRREAKVARAAIDTMAQDSTQAALPETTWVDIPDTTVETVVVEADTTIVEHKVGDPMMTRAGKPYYDLRHTVGLLMGATRQEAARVDSLEARVADLEDRVDNTQNILLLVAAAAGVSLVVKRGRVKKAA